MRKAIACLLLCAVAMLYSVISFSQQNNNSINEHEQCGTQEWLETQFRAYPSLRQQYQQMEQRLGQAATRRVQAATANQRTPGTNLIGSIMDEAPVYYIPIVFHIVSTTPAIYTDAQMYALLDTLNKDFGGNNADSTKILNGFKPLFGKGNIRFCLAQRTPTGGVTNGIMRYTSATISSGSGSTSDPIKSTAAGGADAWDPTRYINVWIGTFSTSGLLGYASFPITSPENPAGLLSQQGLVVEKGIIPGGALTDYNTGRVLTHEIGHFFWLRHIWGDATCGDDFPNTSVLDDTPAASGPSSGCYTGIVATGCTGTAPYGRMYQNYMDYSNSTCMGMFSKGQAVRMALCLDSFRTSLKISNGCQPVVCPTFNIVAATSGTTATISASGGLSPYSYSLDSINFLTSNVFTSLVPGTTYRVYVRDANFCRGVQTFVASGITVSPLSASFFCAGQPVSIGFTTSGIFNAGNVFTARLSDSSGSFGTPVVIGTLTATGNGTINATLPSTILPGKRYRIQVTASSPAVTGSDNGTNIEIANSAVAPAVSIALSVGTNPGCNGRTVAFTAMPTNGGVAPLFQWRRNGNAVDTGRTYTTTVLQNGDVITCDMVSNSACAAGTTATSNSITMALASSLVPSVTISASAADTICSGTTVTFTATPVNSGAAPLYQWRKGDTLTSVTTATYTTSSLLSNEVVTCTLISSLPCATPATATSNQLRFYVNSTIRPSVSISATGTSICTGTPVTFTAIPVNGGTAPVFQWRKNGVNVGINSTTYLDSFPATGDTVSCVMTRTTPAVCLSATTVTSNTLRMTIQNCGTQLLSGNAFLKDSYIEMAISPCGAFGSTVSAPAGYHPRGAGSVTSASQLGFVADSAKSGWTNYVGDYFLPGVPEEGFGVTINGASYNNNQICSVNSIAGSVINVQSSSLEKSATWQGTAGGLTITAKTFIPAGALYFVTKVTVTNTSSAALNNVYYMRNVDPDQGSLTPGSTGTPLTYNSVVFQTPNACNRALVSATTRLTGSEYMGLGSIDARARVSLGGFANRDASAIWNGSGVSLTGTNVYADNAVSIAFNLGTLNINQSTTFSYAYILSQSDLEQALAATATNVSINGVVANTGNTTDVCAGSVVPIRLSNTSGYTNWTWSPATGLDVATGVTVNATVTSPIVYTATGTGPCGTISINIALNPVTQPPVDNAGPITGPAAPAQGATNVVYSIAPVVNAQKYIWTMPAGVVFNSTPDSNVISVRMPAYAFCDSIFVEPRNACGTGARSALRICSTSPYSITLGTVAGICPVAANAFLPYSATTGTPSYYSIIWDTAAQAAGFINVTNAVLPASPISIAKPANTPPGNYTGQIIVGNGSLGGPLTPFTVPVLNIPVVIPSVTIVASTGNTICSGTPVTFTATPVNGGATPIFQWRRNGIATGSNSPTFIISGLLNGDSITCTMTSSAGCASPAVVTSNKIIMTVVTTAVPSVSINTPGGSYACTGSTVTFTATPLNSVSPVFQWFRNGVAVASGATYTVSDIVTGDSIFCRMTATNPCATTVTINSNVLGMTVTTVTIPTASGATTIDCGTATTLLATPTTTGNIINWYTTATGGSSIARSNTLTVTPAGTTTYYAEAGSQFGNVGKQVTAIATSGAVVIDHDYITGDDRCGIVTGANNVYCTGDSYTGKFSKSLTNGVSLPLRDGFFSDLSNGDLWQIGTNTSAGVSFNNGTATRFYKLDSNLVPTGTFLTLSQSITLSSSSFIAAGSGFVILYYSGTFYRINLVSGLVTTSTTTGFSFNSSEGWASYGWAETDGTNYFVCYASSYTTISKINVATGAISILQTFSNLGETANVTLDQQANRMYFHHEGSSQFGGGSETMGYVSVTATAAVPLCASARVPVTVTVNAPSLVPSINIISNYSGTVCYNTPITFTASATNGGLIPAYQWRRNGVNVATGVTYIANALNNNDVISCVLTSSLFCVNTPTAVSNSITVSVLSASTYPSVSVSASPTGTVCYGTSVTYFASVANAGTAPTYQWTKNGIVTGSNSPLFTDVLTAASTISCTITTSTPCATTTTSSGLYLSPTTPVQPAITISSTATSICTGAPVTFTAAAINGGSTPTYQWRRNGTVVASGITYTASAFTNGDSVTCTLISSLPCVTQASISSNAIIISVSTMPTMSAVPNQSTCPGSTVAPVTFTGSTGATFSWVNNNPSIGLPASGIGNLPAFTAVNTGTGPATATVTVTPLGAATSYAYIANNNSASVSVVNLTTNTVMTTIPVGLSPWSVAATPDGSKVYVSCLGSSNVYVINTNTNQVAAVLTTNGQVYDMCVSPDGTRLYTSGYSSGYIYIFNTATNLLLNSIYVGGNLYGIATSPDGSRLYASYGSNLYTYNTATFSFVSSLYVGTGLYSITPSLDGSRLYMVNSAINGLSVVSTTSNAIITSIPTGSNPYNSVLSPDGSKLYVTNYSSGTVSVVNTTTNAVTSTITTGGSGPSGISINASGQQVYVTNQGSNTVSVINTASNTVASTVAGFSGPVSWGNFIASRTGCNGTPVSFTISVAAPNSNTWVGRVSTDWNNTSNWICGRIPTITDNVFISTSENNYYPVLLSTDSVTIRSIRLQPGTSVRVSTGGSLKLTNN